MYLVRFSYDVNPGDRNEVLDFIRQEIKAARARQLNARLLVPLTRGRGEAALEYEVELSKLDDLEDFRERGVGADEQTTHEWMRKLSLLLEAPPGVAVFRIDEIAPRESVC